MDIRWGFIFWKGELECERPQSTYIPEPSVVPATQKPKGDRSCLSLGVLPWIAREEGPRDSTLTTTDFRAGRKEEHVKQSEDPNCIHFGFWTPVLPHPLARYNCNHKNNEYFRNLLGQYWNLDAEERSKNSFASSHVESLCHFFFLERPASLSPPEKNLILMKTEKQFEKNLRSRKKLSSSIPGKEGSQPTFHNCQKHPSCLFSFCNNHWSFCSVILQFFKRWILL